MSPTMMSGPVEPPHVVCAAAPGAVVHSRETPVARTNEPIDTELRFPTNFTNHLLDLDELPGAGGS
jgi:hypothetical protein